MVRAEGSTLLKDFRSCLTYMCTQLQFPLLRHGDKEIVLTALKYCVQSSERLIRPYAVHGVITTETGDQVGRVWACCKLSGHSCEPYDASVLTTDTRAKMFFIKSGNNVDASPLNFPQYSLSS